MERRIGAGAAGGSRGRRALPAPAVRAVLGLRRGLLAAADLVVPAQVAVLDRALQDQVLAAAEAAARLGVADALAGGPRTAAEVAEELALDPVLLHRTLRVLAAAGFLRLRRDDVFVPTRLGRALARGAGTAHDPVRYLLGRTTREAWLRLGDALAGGGPPFRAAHGSDVWQHLAAHPGERERFAAAMRRGTELDAPEVVARYRWPETGVVADLAGGAGALLAAVLARRPGLAGVLVETAEMLPEAGAHLKARGLDDRVELVAGDLLSGVDVRADVYLLKHVLHDWDDAAATRILRAVRSTVAPGAEVVVVEYLQERDRPAYPASFADLQMAVICEGGRERSLAELRTLLEQAGLAPGGVRVTGTGLAVLTARG